MTMMRAALLTACLAAAPVAQAWEIDNLGGLTQNEFRLFSEDLVSALSYKAITPAEPLGITGFDLGIEVTAMKTDHSAIWQTATGSDVNILPVPKLHLHKGLPFDLDVGAFYTAVPGSDIKLYGAELRYAVVSGNVAVPAVAIRGAATKLVGVSQLDLDTRSLELTVSKGLLMFTPYAGIGRIWSNVDPNGITSTVTGLALTKESPSMTRMYAGLNFNALLGNIAVEVEKTGGNVGASAKLGIRW